MMGKGKDIKIKEGFGLVETELYILEILHKDQKHSVVSYAYIMHFYRVDIYYFFIKKIFTTHVSLIYTSYSYFKIIHLFLRGLFFSLTFSYKIIIIN